MLLLSVWQCETDCSMYECVLLTEAFPVGLDLWVKAAHFPLKLQLGFFHQFTVLCHNLGFRLCSLHLCKKKCTHANIIRCSDKFLKNMQFTKQTYIFKSFAVTGFRTNPTDAFLFDLLTFVTALSRSTTMLWRFSSAAKISGRTAWTLDPLNVSITDLRSARTSLQNEKAGQTGCNLV